MSIARAFTLRNKRADRPASPQSPAMPHSAGLEPASPRRAQTVRRMASVIDRNQISAPVELISTTNMLSYNAPDVSVVRKMRQASSASSSSSSSSSSGDDSDGSSPVRSSSELTDASSVGSSSPTTPEPNHLSCYFKAAQEEQEHQRLSQHKSPRRSASSVNLHRKTMSDASVPAIPQRALSHSKSAHLQLARKRSMQSISSTHTSNTAQSHSTQGSLSVRSLHSANTNHSHSVSRSSSFKEHRASADFFKSSVEPNHPFGKELEQLSEVVEELGGTIRDAEAQEDVATMREKGLVKWSVDDYLMELRPLYLGSFSDRNHPTAVNPAWI